MTRYGRHTKRANRASRLAGRRRDKTLKTAGQMAPLQLEMDSGAGVLRVIFTARIGVAAAPDRDVVAQ